MIQETITYTCHSYDSINIVKNGTNKCGNQQYHGKDCGVYRVLTPQTPRLSEAEKQKVLQAYREWVSLRGLERIFRVCRKSIMQWLATEIDQLPSLAETLLPPTSGDVLELNEAWSFVG